MSRDNWLGLESRLRQAGANALRNNSNGCAIITVSILVNSQGDPLAWAEPTIRRIEPSASSLAAIVNVAHSVDGMEPPDVAAEIIAGLTS